MSLEKLRDEQVNELLRSLVTGTGYNGRSPLREMVEARISAMARDIAAELVKAEPQLEQAIRTRTREVIFEALRQDRYLNRTVTDAVAKALGEVALERREDEPGG